MKKANRDMEELAKLKDKTAAIRTGSFKEEPEGGALAAVENSKPEPTGPAAAEGALGHWQRKPHGPPNS